MLADHNPAIPTLRSLMEALEEEQKALHRLTEEFRAWVAAGCGSWSEGETLHRYSSDEQEWPA